MKKLFTLLCMLSIVWACFAQTNQVPANQKMRLTPVQHKRVGGIVFTTLGVAAITGSIFMIKDAADEVKRRNGDYSTLFGSTSIGEIYLPGVLMAVGGAAFTAIGINKLVKANKMQKRLQQTSLFISPIAVPSGLQGSTVLCSRQTSVSLIIPVGK